MLNLKDLETKVTEALEKETYESLTTWLNQKRGGYSEIIYNSESEFNIVLSFPSIIAYFEDGNFSEQVKNYSPDVDYFKAA